MARTSFSAIPKVVKVDRLVGKKIDFQKGETEGWQDYSTIDFRQQSKRRYIIEGGT